MSFNVNSSTLRESTRRINPQTASLQEIENALLDCRSYWGAAYPEDENELVTRITDELEQAINDRFSQHGTAIMKTIRARCRLST